MHQILLFFLGASLTGAVFLLSLIELFLTLRRRQMNEELRAKVKELKESYNTSINKLVIDDDSKLIEAEHEVEEVTTQSAEAIKEREAEFEKKMAEAHRKSEKAIEAARAKAKKLQEEAKDQADSYLKNRKKEVEEELMNLVISVTKKVLPESLTYQVHKELVLQALRDVKAETDE